MQLAMIGLGMMGGAVTERLIQGGHSVVVYDRSADAVTTVVALGRRIGCALCESIFKTLAPPNGYAHVGPTGAGHYVKMVHNGIEYGMLHAFACDGSLADINGYVADSGEGRRIVQEAIDLDVPAPVITLSLLMRLRSRQQDSFGARVIAPLRNEFGGHAVKRA